MDLDQFVITLLDKYGIQTVIVLVLLILLFRTLPSTLRAISTFMQTRANAAAAVQTTEVQNEAKVLDILQQQVVNTTTTNNILMQWQGEFSQTREAVNRVNQTNERLEIAINEFNTETKALRVDVKSYPDLLDGTMAALVTTVDTMRANFDRLQTSSSAEHATVIDLLTETHRMVNVLYRRALLELPPPPDQPARAGKPENITPLDADGAADNALTGDAAA